MNKIRFNKIFSLILNALVLVVLLFSLTIKNVKAEDQTYETADEISVSDLLLNSKSIGNKIVTDAHHNYTYNKTSEYGSVIFRFTFKSVKWDDWNDGFQIHLYNTWQQEGMFWLRKDAAYISYYNDDNELKYSKSSKGISAGSHSIEIGRLAIMNNGSFTGSHYLYFKLDNELYCEYTTSKLEAPQYTSNGIFTTGTSGNIMLDSNWNGSKVTFMANGSVYKEINTTDDYIEKPSPDPVQAGKTFVGWFDKMGKEWDFSKNQVTDNLVLKAGFKGTDYSDDETYFSDSNFTPVLRFMLGSDTHIGTSDSSRDSNLSNSITSSYQIATNSPKYKKLDAILIAGDITDNGDSVALARFNQIATSSMKNETQLVVSMGNHDFRGASATESINQFKNMFGAVDKHIIINGYHFIILSPDLSEGEHFSESKAIWLDEQLSIATLDTPDKPVFVMQHEHIYGTVYGSEAWYVTELTDVITKYPQVVDMSGHSHYPLTDPRSIWQGSFTAIGTGTMHYYEMGINGYKNTGVFPSDKVGGWNISPSPASSGGEFQIIEVDSAGAIRITAYDILTNTVINRYYIRNATDEIKFKYSHTERAKASDTPVFGSDASIELTPVKATIHVKFDQATSNEVIDSYIINVYKGSELIKTEYALSANFVVPAPGKIEYTISSLASETEYNFKIYAVNVWGKVSANPLTGSATTEYVDYGEEGYDSYDLINILDIDYPGNTGILENIPSESKVYNYPGKSPNYGAVIRYYLITGDLTSKDEFRTQVGTNWTNNMSFWIQTGKYDVIFYSWKFSTSPSDRTKFNIESNKIYKIEYGTILVGEGEHEGEYYTYINIDDVLIKGFYVPPAEFNSKDYTVSMHLSDNYKIADYSLARNIEYYVDDTVYKTDFGINGLGFKEPASPTKEGLFFVGWYTEKNGGDVVDFSSPLNSDSETVKYYARFTDTTYDIRFYDEDGSLLETQLAGKDCKVIKPQNPVKTGEYKYSFVKWVIKGTDQEFDFNTLVTKEYDLQAVYEEYKYKIVYLVDGVEYTTKYFVESNPSVIIGGEPDVPEFLGSTGHWEYQTDRTNKDIYVRCRFDGVETTPSNEISLNKFDGATIDIADDLTRFYLSFADTLEQANWIDTYPVGGGHERQNISFSWSDSSKNKAYLVYFADNAEFEDAFIVQTNSKSVDYVGIFVPGKTYYWKVVGLTNNNSSSVDTFKILNTPVRWISAGTVFNVRDIGGWTTTDNKVVNYGLIYRGGQLSLDQPSELSYMNDYSFKVFDYLKMKTEIELRGDMPHEFNQFNKYENLILVKGDNYMGLFSMSDSTKGNYREVFKELADINNYPFYFHCSWGADRTGSLGFLINGLLGVPFEQLVEDYELTSLSNSGTRTRYGWSNGAFMQMYETFINNYSNGGTLQDGITRYLIQYIGVTEEQIASIKNIMLSDAEGALTTHTVTYIIDGEIYQRSNVFDGECIKEITPVFFDKHLDCWLLDGVPFDVNTKVTQDLVLEARFKETLYEEYDVITVRDLALGESFVPTASNHTYQGTAPTGSRMFVFDYEITANDGAFDDGVHIEIGSGVWNCRAHIWFQGLTSIHIFVDGLGPNNEMRPIATYNRRFVYGETYRISIGVLIPLEGDNAGKKMFVILLDDELLSFIPTTSDIASNYNIGIAGTEGVLKSVDNLRKVEFIGADGTVIETKEVSRGSNITAVDSTNVTGKVFLGWFDELGTLFNFETDVILKDTKLFAKFGDRTIDAVVVDINNIEIYHGYKVKIGILVNEIEIPLVFNDNLEFEGWYNGTTKLEGTDRVNENMNLICKFKVVENKPVEPVNPVDPSNPDRQKNGCKSSLSLGLSMFGLLPLAGIIFIKKRRNERD